jgi:cysteine desulfurase
MPAKSAIYLDANAGLPLLDEVKFALREALSSSNGDFPFNPSSPHSLGQQSRRLLESSRRQVLESILSSSAKRSVSFLHSSSLVFTGSGTEANQWVIRSVLLNALQKHGTAHWVTTLAEHDSVLQMVDWAKAQGVKVSLLPMGAQGQPDFPSYIEALKEPPALITLLLVNNETGVVLHSSHRSSAELEEAALPLDSALLKRGLAPWVEAAQACGARVHLDAAQAWGKLPLEVDQLGADFVTFSAHKIGALAGSGALWISPRYAMGAEAITGGLILGKAESSKRGGTPSVLAALAMGTAAAVKSAELLRLQSDITRVRDRFESKLLRAFGSRVQINGAYSHRVANTSSVSFHDLNPEGFIAALDLKGYAVSSGAACSSGTLEPSHVLKAMGLSSHLARASIRVSFPDSILRLEQSNLEWMEEFIQALEQAVARMARPLDGSSSILRATDVETNPEAGEGLRS